MIDPAANRVVSRIDVGRQPTTVAAGYGGVWVLNKGEGTITHLDAHTGKRIATIDSDAAANTLSLGAGGVWFAGPRRGVSAPIEDAKFERINPSTGVVDRTFETTTGAAVGGGSVWISESDGTVLRIDPKLSGIKASIPACRNAIAIAYGEGSA